MATREELTVAVTGVQSSTTDLRNEVLAAISRAETRIAELQAQLDASGDFQQEVDSLNAVITELNSSKTAIQALVPDQPVS